MMLFGRRLHLGHALLFALLITVVLLSVRLVGALREPSPEIPAFQPPQLADPAVLARHDIFFPDAPTDGSDLPVTALPFSLHGLRADSATGRGSAIIATGGGEQSLYEVGDALGDGATLASIAADHVVIEHSGRHEALWLDSAGTTPVERFVSVDPHADTDLPDAGEPADVSPENNVPPGMPQPHFGDAAAIPIAPPSEAP